MENPPIKHGIYKHYWLMVWKNMFQTINQ